MLRNCPRQKELKRRPGGGKLGYDTISSFLNLNKYCSFRLLYSWKVLASLKAWFKLWLSRFRWNVTVSRRVRGGGGRGALFFRLNGLCRWTGYRFSGSLSDVCNRSFCVIPFKTARVFTIKPLANRMSCLDRMPFETSTNVGNERSTFVETTIFFCPKKIWSMMLVEKAKTKRIKDHKIISLTLKQGSEMNNLFISSILFFPGISQTNSMTNSPSFASFIVSVSVTLHHLISAVNLFRSFSFALFFFLGFSSCCKLYRLSFAWNCGWQDHSLLWRANFLEKGNIYSSKSSR